MTWGTLTATTSNVKIELFEFKCSYIIAEWILIPAYAGDAQINFTVPESSPGVREANILVC